MNTDNKLSKQQLLQELTTFLNTHKTRYQKTLKTNIKFKYLLDFVFENSQLLNDAKYSLLQRIHWVLNGLSDFPACLQCGRKLDRPTDFKGINYGYNKTCCLSCSNKHNSIQAKKTRFAKNNGKYFSDESLEKTRQTFIDHYGVDNNMKSEEGRKKHQDAVEAKYGKGIKNVFQAKSVKQRISNTKEKKHGDKNYNNPDKISKTLLSRTPEQWQQTVEKTQHTNIDHFGETSPMKVPEIVEKGILTKQKNKTVTSKKNSKIVYDGQVFDSYPEVCFYIWAIDTGYDIVRLPLDKAIKYEDKLGKTHTYYPDFYIKTLDQLVEIKGDFFNVERENFKVFSKNLSDGAIIAAKAKFECMHKNNVLVLTNTDYKKYLDYVSVTYGYTTTQQLKQSIFSDCSLTNIKLSK